MTARVLITDPIAADGVQVLERHFQVDTRVGLKGQELLDELGGYDALIVRSETAAPGHRPGRGRGR